VCERLFLTNALAGIIMNEVHFGQNELFVFYTIENHWIAIRKMKSKNYRIP